MGWFSCSTAVNGQRESALDKLGICTEQTASASRSADAAVSEASIVLRNEEASMDKVEIDRNAILPQ
ncbi:unnamed protein product [Anisakis simplex]|uniref:Uncharacterized protein n=1 Tax=Anisakis simplex TaxID=6269 RepID=A0A0M3K9U0_ANISI|nr:unnamed protein product [Anisakis simplex]